MIKESKKLVGTTDLTPTWKTAARIYLAALENGSDAGRQAAREGIMEMANAADALNVRVGELVAKLETK